MAIKVLLGNFTFELSPRTSISFTGARSIAKIEIPGAVPRYQDMGEDEQTYSFSGVMTGNDAFTQCIQVKNIKSSGKQVSFVAGKINTIVRIKDFNYEYVRNDRINYSITLIDLQLGTSSGNASKAAISQTSSSVASKQKILNYKVQKGDTLMGIAQKYKTDWKKISALNNIKNPRNIKVGTILKIPVGGNNA